MARAKGQGQVGRRPPLHPPQAERKSFFFGVCVCVWRFVTVVKSLRPNVGPSHGGHGRGFGVFQNLVEFWYGEGEAPGISTLQWGALNIPLAGRLCTLPWIQYMEANERYGGAC